MKTKLKLYRVTLDWDSDPSEGTFTHKVWAKDAAAALKATANEMADAQSLAGKDRRDAIAIWSNVDINYAVEDIAIEVKDSVYALLIGPTNTGLSKEAEHARRVILDLLEIYGGGK